MAFSTLTRKKQLRNKAPMSSKSGLARAAKRKATRPKEYAEPGVILHQDGRHECDRTKAGRDAYALRKLAMAARQDHTCAAPFCLWPLRSAESFDHENNRGLGGCMTDDRIEIDGKRVNACVHHACNTRMGSVRYHWVDDETKYVPRQYSSFEEWRLAEAR